MKPLLSDTVKLVLDGVGRANEYEYYLKRFQNTPQAHFAIFLPDLQSCQEAASDIGNTIVFLRTLGLYPILYLSGPAAQAQLQLLQQHKHINLDYQCFTLKPYATPKELSLLDRKITESFKKKSLILMSPTLNLQQGIATLQNTYPTLRLHIIRMGGALRNTKGKTLNLYYHPPSSSLNLKETPKALEDEPCRKEDLAILKVIQNIYKKFPKMHISLSSPYLLLREIFTIKGGGTVFREKSLFVSHKNTIKSKVDKKKLSLLLNRSYGKTLAEQSLLEKASHYYIESNFKGVIILMQTRLGHYLSKFAVDISVRGLGLASELWQNMETDIHEGLFWRCKHQNSFLSWYIKICDGYQKEKDWCIFWKRQNKEKIPEIIDFCNKEKDSFISNT